MLNSLQQMYYGIRNTNSTRETYSQAMGAPQATRDASGGAPRPLQQTYSRYIVDQENFNHINHPNNVKNRVRFDPHPQQPNLSKNVVSRNPTSKSQNVSVQHTRTATNINKEFSQEKLHKVGLRQSKQ